MFRCKTHQQAMRSRAHALAFVSLAPFTAGLTGCGAGKRAEGQRNGAAGRSTAGGPQGSGQAAVRRAGRSERGGRAGAAARHRWGAHTHTIGAQRQLAIAKAKRGWVLRAALPQFFSAAG